MACVILATSSPAMQQLPDASLRAAYLFNFARYTEWPAAALPANAPLTICTDDDAVGAGLGAIVYSVALDSAVEAAEKRREQILTALSAGEGPVTA